MTFNHTNKNTFQQYSKQTVTSTFFDNTVTEHVGNTINENISILTAAELPTEKQAFSTDIHK